MASEEERARILAEYMKDADADTGDEEPEWNAGESDSDDSEDFNDDSTDGDAKPSHEENYAILQGALVLNDEGRLVFSGTWCMKSDLDNADGTTLSGQSTDVTKKKTKFKLKSKQQLSGKNFSLANPLLADLKPRVILFDGFFNTDATDTIEPYRKIKERDVEITFSQGVNGKNGDSSSSILVKGQGTNDFGSFNIEGIYRPVPPFSLTVSKRYSIERTNNEYDSEDIEGDEGDAADSCELIGLHEEATLSIEELRKRYNGSGADEKDSEKKISVKKPKYDEDDEECGF